MSIYTNKYDNSKVGLLKQLLLNNEQSGKPTEYEIKVDNLKIVPRTADASQFKLLEESIDADTKAITITLYEGQGRSSDKHIFYFKEANPTEPVATLSGLDVDKKVNEKMEAYKKQMEYEKLEEKNKELAKQLSDAEEYIGELEGKLEIEKEGRLKVKGIHFGEIASVAAESLIRRNAHILARIPGAEGLAGLIMEDSETKRDKPESSSQGEASFTSAEETQALSEEDQERLDWLKDLETRLDEKEIGQFFMLVNILISDTKILELTLAYVVKLKEKQSNTAKQESKNRQVEKNETPASESGERKHEEVINLEDLDSVPEIRDAA